MILDVGCGDSPKGDINCDLYIKDIFNHRNKKFLSTLNTHKILNFVNCDCQYLPFINNSFNEVISNQVIEHVKNPLLMFKELVRVSKDKIIIETVHRTGEHFQASFKPKSTKWFKEHHINKFNFATLNNYGKKLNCVFIKGYVLSFYYFPHEYLCLFKVPYEIGVIFKK